VRSHGPWEIAFLYACRLKDGQAEEAAALFADFQFLPVAEGVLVGGDGTCSRAKGGRRVARSKLCHASIPWPVGEAKPAGVR